MSGLFANQWCRRNWSHLLSNIDLYGRTFCHIVGTDTDLCMSCTTVMPLLQLSLTQLSLVDCLSNFPPSSTEAQGSHDDIRIEAAHVISSISYGKLYLSLNEVIKAVFVRSDTFFRFAKIARDMCCCLNFCWQWVSAVSRTVTQPLFIITIFIIRITRSSSQLASS